MAGGLPGVAEHLDLLGLELVERHTGAAEFLLMLVANLAEEDRVAAAEIILTTST